MSRLIESLTPDNRRFYWRWVAGVFSLYVALLIAPPTRSSATNHRASLRMKVPRLWQSRETSRLYIRASMPVRQAMR